MTARMSSATCQRHSMSIRSSPLGTAGLSRHASAGLPQQLPSPPSLLSLSCLSGGVPQPAAFATAGCIHVSTTALPAHEGEAECETARAEHSASTSLPASLSSSPARKSVTSISCRTFANVELPYASRTVSASNHMPLMKILAPCRRNVTAVAVRASEHDSMRMTKNQGQTTAVLVTSALPLDIPGTPGP